MHQMNHADQMFQWELLVILQLGAEWKAKKRRSGFVKKRQGRAEGWKGWDWFFNHVFCPPASLTRPTLRIVQPQWRRRIQKRFCTSKTGLGCHAFYNGGLWIKSRGTIVKEAVLQWLEICFRIPNDVTMYKVEWVELCLLMFWSIMHLQIEKNLCAEFCLRTARRVKSKV